MTTSTTDPLVRTPSRSADLQHQLGVANARVAQLAAEVRALRSRIDGAVFLVDQFDPYAGAGRTVQFQADLRATLNSTPGKSAKS